MSFLSRAFRTSLLAGACVAVLLGLAPLTAAAQNPGEPDPSVDEIPPVGPGGVGEATGLEGQPTNVLWLRATDLEASAGDPVGTWNDISGNDHDYSQGNSGNQPVYEDGSDGINQTAVLNFDGTNDVLTDSDGNDYITGTDSLTAIYVVQSDKVNYDGGLFTTHVPDVHDTNAHTFRYDANGAESGSANTIKFAVTTNKTSDGGGDSDESETSEGVSTSSGTLVLHSTSPRLYTASWRSGDFLDLWVNGFEETDLDRAGKGEGSPGSGPSGLNGTLDEQAGEVVRVGQGAKDGNNDGNAPGGHWDGDIAEVIIYRDKLNTTQRRLVETYLQTRYAFGNFNDDLYGFDDTHPAGVGGIGRTSASDVHLKGGSSIIELDAEDASNLSDGDFAVLGHDGRQLDYTTNERPNEDTRADDGANVQKVKREWKVDLTGSSSQTVSVDVDLSSLFFPSGYNDFALFVDDDGDFTDGATFYDLDSSGEVSGVTIEDGDYVTVASIQRTISYKTSSSSKFENARGDGAGDAFAPDLNVELNYTNSTAITGIPYTVSGVTSTLVEDTDDTFGNEGPANQEDYRKTDDTFSIAADTETKNVNAGGGVFEILNDFRDASSATDEQTAEELDVDLDTGSLPSALAAGGPTTFTFTINDDDDPRKVSFASGGSGSFKPTAILGSNPEEDNDPNGDNQTGEENTVGTVSFEVALPEGVEGSPTTKAVFEVTGGDTDDFSIPANGSNEKISDRKGRVVINTTKTVDGDDAGTGTSDTGYGTFDLDITDDELFENDKTLTVTLTSAQSASLDPDSNADLDLDYTILNDDPTPEVDFQLSSNSGDESTSDVTATLRLTEQGGNTLQASGTDLDVDFSVSGTATAGTDYTQNTSSPTTILAGNTTREVRFSVSDDQVQEANESIIVDIEYSSSDTEAAEPSSGNKTFTYTIFDNDNIGPDGPGGVGDGDALQVWLDASEGVNQSEGGSPSGDGDPVGEWVDQGANAHDFTGSDRPTLQTGAINGRPALDFNGSGNVLSDGDGANQYVNTESAFSALSVVQPASTPSDGGIFVAQNGGGTNTAMMRYNNSGSDLELSINTNASGGTSRSFTAGSQSTNPQILQYDWDSGSAPTFYFDGASQGSGSSIGGGLRNANTVLIGGGPSNWSGDIAETIFYTQQLNQAQRRIVTNYLSAKYDIAPNTDQYKGDTGFGITDGNDGDPSNGGDYDLGVIGVGQAGGEVHTRARQDGIDIQVKNGLDNDGDFVMAGHRVPDNSISTAGVGSLDGTSSDNRRSARTWAVDWDNSGTALEVDLTFDISALGFQGLAGDASNYQLIESSSDDTGSGYSWSATSATASVSGSKITFRNVSLTSGNYYTLATTDKNASPLSSSTALVVSGSDGNEGNANLTPNTYGGDAGWRLLGVPVENAAAGDIFSGTDDPFVEFDLIEPMMVTWDDDIANSPADGNYADVGSGTAIPNGRGFALFLFDDEGTPDADPIDPDLVLDVGDGLSTPGDNNVTVGDNAPASDDALNTDAEYHLLSNPYSVPYDLSGLDLVSTSGIQNTVQIWDGGRSAGGSYITATDNGSTGDTESVPSGDVIAPWQGFFVQRSSVGSGPTSLTFNNDGRTTGPRSIVGSKSRTQAKTEEATQLKLKLVTRNDRDSLITRDRAASLYFSSDASSGWDAYDANKLFPLTASGDPWATIAPLGTGSDGTVEPKAVESRSWSKEDFTVPLELRTSSELDGTMTITAPLWRNVTDGWTFKLVDTKGTSQTGDDTVHELTPGGEGYSFAYSASKSSSAKSKASSTKADAKARDGERVPPPIRTAGTARPKPRKMEMAARNEKTAKDETIPTRFKLRVSPGRRPNAESDDATPGQARPVAFAEVPNTTVKEKSVILKWETASSPKALRGFSIKHRSAEPGASFTDLDFVERKSTAKSGSVSYRYEADSLAVGEHNFRILQVNADGTSKRLKTLRAQVSLEETFTLSKAYPNPFRQTTKFDLIVQNDQKVTVALYDVLGRRVRTIHDGPVESNERITFRVDGRDLASGYYIVRVRGKNFSTTRRAVVVK